jgi:hypothetical protein
MAESYAILRSFLEFGPGIWSAPINYERFRSLPWRSEVDFRARAEPESVSMLTPFPQ